MAPPLIGLARVAHEALQYLTDRRDLGVHSDLISDAILPLLEERQPHRRLQEPQALQDRGQFGAGPRALYDRIDGNPLFSFEPMEAVATPTIAAQHKMVATAQALPSTSRARRCIDQFGGEFYSGLGSQGEFLRGAAPGGGKPIVHDVHHRRRQRSRIPFSLLAGEAATIARTGCTT